MKQSRSASRSARELGLAGSGESRTVQVDVDFDHGVSVVAPRLRRGIAPSVRVLDHDAAMLRVKARLLSEQR